MNVETHAFLHAEILSNQKIRGYNAYTKDLKGLKKKKCPDKMLWDKEFQNTIDYVLTIYCSAWDLAWRVVYIPREMLLKRMNSSFMSRYWKYSFWVIYEGYVHFPSQQGDLTALHPCLPTCWHSLCELLGALTPLYLETLFLGVPCALWLLQSFL